MSQVITNAFEQYWQSCLAAEKPVVLDEFILADIPNLDITSPIDPETGLPPESQIVHRQNVDQRGRINNNAVAYTIVMDTTVGDFSFNAMYLRNKQNGVIGMIVYKGRETKLKTDQTTGQTGNSLVKSMLMGYDQAAEATLTNVDAGTWQIDYAARLRGMDEDIRQLQADLYGHHTFVGDGFKVVEKDGAYQVTQGVAIVGGLRVELKAPEVIHPGTKTIGVWVDVHRAGSLLSEHQNHFNIITSVADLTDHVDSNGYQHYVAKLATVRADGTIEDGRGSAGGGSSGSGAIPDTFALWKRSMAEAGYNLIGQFGTELTIETSDQAVLSKDGSKVYSWLGMLPKFTDANEAPTEESEWNIVSERSLRGDLRGGDGAGKIGIGNTTVKRILESEFFIDYFAPVLDYGPIFNATMQNSIYGGKIKLRGERYPVSTTIKRRAGWGIEGVGPYATEINWVGGDDALIQYDKVMLKSRNGEVIGNESGQYHTSLQKLSLIGNGKGIGLWRGEGWWDRVSEVIIEGFDIGQKDGIGYSNQSGCFWCVNDQVWYRNNRVNLHVTDGSNLNLWSMCRFSGATDWDIEFVEPTNAQVLGQQGNRFTDCEWASNDAIYLGAKIFDLNFHNPYFEQAGYAVYDGTSHVKGSVTFTGTPKFFGKKSVKNKIVAGHNGGSCQNWAFYNLKTNLGKGVGAPDINYLIDMGDGANYFSVIGPTVQTGADGWELTQDSNYSRLKMQLFDVNGKSVLFAKSISSELVVANKSHTVADYKNLRDVGVDMFESGVVIGELSSSWHTVMTIPDFVIQYAFATLHCELTISGRNPNFNRIHSAHIGFELDSENGAILNNVEIYNRQTGTANVHVEYRLLVDGEVAMVQVRNDSTSLYNLYDQVYCAVEAKVAGKFPAMCA
ncbi:phage tail-collar fiber domain-containing protein [Aeromonas veronii]|uniref:phage tail-collar fiber domain-containing protein n=1 Tax=Aeromonas veronii TaxID=654 RepID=UPI002B486AB9|nr:phage tail protein [Aeromonas veronii]